MRLTSILLLAGLILTGLAADAATGKVIKVLPHFVDQMGRHAISPSLYERDAYQNELFKNPEKRLGIRFDIHWNVKEAEGANLKLRVEMRGVATGNQPQDKTLEKSLRIKGKSDTQWTSIPLVGDDYKAFGEMTAWRVTLWDGDTKLGEEKSFLWDSSEADKTGSRTNQSQ